MRMWKVGQGTDLVSWECRNLREMGSRVLGATFGGDLAKARPPRGRMLTENLPITL